MKRNNYIGILVLVILVLLPSMVGAKVLDQAKITVRAHVPVMQEITIIEPVVVEFDYPWEGQSLTVNDVGLVRIASNANWSLNMDVISTEGFRVQAKPAQDRFANWQAINGFSAISGGMGSYDYSFDLEIEATSASNITPGHKAIQLLFTLSHI